jgi:hypothetical protein
VHDRNDPARGRALTPTRSRIADWTASPDSTVPAAYGTSARALPFARLLTTTSTDAWLPNLTTDLRFALEAMTQMMRTHNDALRIVAESQVDLAKAIATAKGLPRNATTAQLAPPHAEDYERALLGPPSTVHSRPLRAPCTISLARVLYPVQ